MIGLLRSADICGIGWKTDGLETQWQFLKKRKGS